MQTHLLTPAQLESLERSNGLPVLSDGLRREGIVTGDSGDAVRATDLELSVRRWAGGFLHLLGRWAGSRSAALPALFHDEDRRSVRALLRGAAQHAEATRRLAGLIPTPALPERALEELARAPSTAAVVSLLSAWHHPFADSLARVVSVATPDLYRLEAALAHAWARELRRAARVSGDGAIRKWVKESLDLDNVMTALALADEGTDVEPAELFLAGGERLEYEYFARAIATRSGDRAGAELARCFGHSAMADVIRRANESTATLEDAILGVRIDVTAREVRVAPLGPLAVMLFGMRLRKQVSDLLRLIWQVSLGAPRSAHLPRLVPAAR